MFAVSFKTAEMAHRVVEAAKLNRSPSADHVIGCFAPAHSTEILQVFGHGDLTTHSRSPLRVHIHTRARPAARRAPHTCTHTHLHSLHRPATPALVANLYPDPCVPLCTYRPDTSLQCVCGDVFTASCDIEPTGCAFAWFLLLLSVVAHACLCCRWA